MTTKTPKPRTSFVEEVLRLYTNLPDTPECPRPPDRLLAAELERKAVPLSFLRAAFILGSARRTFGARSLPAIRSLHYFLPVLDEIQRDPPDPSYLDYIERRLRATLDG